MKRSLQDFNFLFTSNDHKFNQNKQYPFAGFYIAIKYCEAITEDKVTE